jgi:hypothetical protein
LWGEASESLFQVREVAEGGAGRCISAIKEEVKIDGAHPTGLSGRSERNKVIVVRMHTTRPQETAKMETATFRSAERAVQLSLTREGSVRDRGVDTWQFLGDTLP